MGSDAWQSRPRTRPRSNAVQEGCTTLEKAKQTWINNTTTEEPESEYQTGSKGNPHILDSMKKQGALIEIIINRPSAIATADLLIRKVTQN